MRALLYSVLAYALASSSRAAAEQRVPLKDGLYASSAEQCAQMRNGEFDGAPYSVEKAGRLLSGSEEACVIASVKPIRSNRYHVESDCREMDEISQRSFILDIPSRDRFLIEGDEYLWCLDVDDNGLAVSHPSEPGTTSAQASVPPTAAKSIHAAPAPLKKLSCKALISYWAAREEECRGGSGDDPATDLACNLRSDARTALERRGFCYRKAKVGMDWVPCR